MHVLHVFYYLHIQTFTCILLHASPLSTYTRSTFKETGCWISGEDGRLGGKTGQVGRGGRWATWRGWGWSNFLRMLQRAPQQVSQDDGGRVLTRALLAHGILLFFHLFDVCSNCISLCVCSNITTQNPKDFLREEYESWFSYRCWC